MLDTKKLKVPANTTLVLLGAPETFAAEAAAWGKIQYKLGSGKPVWVIAFVRSLADMQQHLKGTFPLLAPEGILWIAFPKKSSGIKTDIDRDSAHQALVGLPAQWLSLVAIDTTWSAFALRKKEDARLWTSPLAVAEKPANPFIDTVARTVRLPDYLAAALAPFPNERAYFESLAFTHRKEYIVWITEAKKTETRDARIQRMIVMLQTHKKNPSEK